jgi:hypothetical protein
MKPISLLLRFVILAPGFGRPIPALIRSLSLSLSYFVTVFGAVTLPPPARPANDKALAASPATNFNSIGNIGKRLAISGGFFLHQIRLTKNPARRKTRVST